MCIRDRYYTGLDPATLKPVYVTTNPHEKAMQRALIQYRNPKNYDLVHEMCIRDRLSIRRQANANHLL